MRESSSTFQRVLQTQLARFSILSVDVSNALAQARYSAVVEDSLCADVDLSY
jgi:hypothetical protein